MSGHTFKVGDRVRVVANYLEAEGAEAPVVRLQMSPHGSRHDQLWLDGIVGMFFPDELRLISPAEDQS